MAWLAAMATLPRNVRSRSPRPLSSRNPQSRPRLGGDRTPKRSSLAAPASHGWRRGQTSDGGRTWPDDTFTPTPPPMVVTRAALEVAEASDADAPASAPKRSRAFALLPLVTVMVIVSAVGLRYARATGQLPWAKLAASMHTTEDLSAASGSEPHAAPSPAPSAAETTSGWTVSHDGHIPIAGGVMFLPKTFVPEPDGTYDLILHFHGNANIVLGSVEHAGLNAVVAVVNWGIRSAPYREKFQVPDAFDHLLAQIDGGVKARGVKTPKLGRVALTSWSAGYGAIESILEHRKSPAAGADPLDAIIAVDGVHAAFLDGDPKRIKERTVLAWVNAAKAAAKGGVMLSMTHSEIDPIEFVSAQRSQLFVLDQLDEEPVAPAVLRHPEHLALECAKIAVAQGKEKRMIPILDVRLGNLRVQGFEGITKEHHIAHLTQMAAVVFPDLVARWNKPRQGEREEDKSPSSSSEQ